MASVRARITAAYGAATLAALVVFAGVVGAERYGATRRDMIERGIETASLAARIIERQGVQSVTLDTAFTVGGMLLPGVTRLLDALPGYIIIGDSSRTLYWSQPVRALYQQSFAAITPQLTADERTRFSADVGNFQAAAFAAIPAANGRIINLNSGRILITAVLFSEPLPGGVTRVVVGTPVQRLDSVISETLSVTVLAAPIILILTIFAAWGLAGRMLEPVGNLVSEVAAITDGRSLHRRIVLEADGIDEFTRLGQTVNAMIGRLETSFGSLRRFTADASHELRTPLAVIRADVERAMHTQTNSHEHAVALEEALQQVSRMTGLVESLLTLARADEGRFDLIREPVPLEPLIREVAETATILGEEPGITVKIPLLVPVTVLGDAERLRQLFLNLATNAVKYTQRGGTVEISLEARHDEAIITVKDDGIGIAAADLPFIFDRFWRVDRARSRTTGGGSGLGLAISQWIAQAHDGRIDVTSRLGRGTVFTVVLPAATPDRATTNTGLSNS